MAMPKPAKLRVAFYVTCLADLIRPQVAEAAVELLRQADCDVIVPGEQSCCGQPGYNSGDYASAARVAKQVITQFEAYDYVVLPSGSCAGMLVHHYPKLLVDEWKTRAQAMARRVFELTDFLDRVCNFVPAAKAPLSVAYHDSCAGLRELHIREQPRRLLARAGVTVKELQNRDVCCGFGGTFCAKMPAISACMADEKISDAQATQATVLCGGDLGCLLALAGRARRENKALECRHVAEVLLGDFSTPAIGEGEERDHGAQVKE